jgi:hypothetical protein
MLLTNEDSLCGKRLLNICCYDSLREKLRNTSEYCSALELPEETREVTWQRVRRARRKVTFLYNGYRRALTVIENRDVTSV